MAYVNTVLCVMLVVSLAISFSGTAAHHASVPAGEITSPDSASAVVSPDSAFAILVEDAASPDSAFDVPADDDAAAPDSDVPSDEGMAALVEQILGPDSDSPTSLPEEEASAPDSDFNFDMAFATDAPYSIPTIDPTVTISFDDGKTTVTVAAPAPFNYAPIIDDVVVENSIPVDKQQQDAQFVEKYLQMAVGNTKTFLTEVLQKKLTNNDHECTDICQQVLLSANDALTHGLKSIDSKEYFDADVEVHAFSSNIKTCIQCYGDAADPELLKFIQWATSVSDACLEKIGKYQV